MSNLLFTFLKGVFVSESLPEKVPVVSARNERFFSELLQSDHLPEGRCDKAPSQGFLSDLLAAEKLPNRNR